MNTLTKRSPYSGPRGTSRVATAASPRLRRILVPLDFSGVSRRALGYAVPIAQRFGATIVAVHVVVPVPVTTPEMALMHGDLGPETRAATARLEKHVKKLIPEPLLERSVVACGNAAPEILRVAEEIDADMIVLTTHGKSGIKRLFMGSTAERVARDAKCPVLTVRSSPARQRRSDARAKQEAHRERPRASPV